MWAGLLLEQDPEGWPCAIFGASTAANMGSLVPTSTVTEFSASFTEGQIETGYQIGFHANPESLEDVQTAGMNRHGASFGVDWLNIRQDLQEAEFATNNSHHDSTAMGRS